MEDVHGPNTVLALLGDVGAAEQPARGKEEELGRPLLEDLDGGKEQSPVEFVDSFKIDPLGSS